MTDVFSRKRRSQIMRQIKSEHTNPELRIRKGLHQLGYRFRLHVKDLPGKPDISLPKLKTVIQVRGCFWHGHNCIDGHLPKSRRTYWLPKLQANKRRDRRNDRKLRNMGWTVLAVWECHCASARALEREIHRLKKALDSGRKRG